MLLLPVVAVGVHIPVLLVRIFRATDMLAAVVHIRENQSVTPINMGGVENQVSTMVLNVMDILIRRAIIVRLQKILFA